MRTVEPADEQRHQPGGERYWSESYYLDFHDGAGRLGGYVRLGLYPNLGAAWYWACVVGQDRRLHTVVDHTVPLPRWPSLEVRSSGLWAAVHAEDALDHMSVGLEAFALAVDDPVEMYAVEPRGDRVGLGFDLSWETDGVPYGYDMTTRYEIPCRVRGEILIGDEIIDFDGFGQRDHSWGDRDWWRNEWMWLAARFDDGERLHAVGRDGTFGVGYRQADAAVTAELTAVAAHPELGDDDLPQRIDVVADGVAVAVSPVAWAPVRLDSPDGEVARFPRALCHVVEGDRRGVGWIELNQPPGFTLGRR